MRPRVQLLWHIDWLYALSLRTATAGDAERARDWKGKLSVHVDRTAKAKLAFGADGELLPVDLDGAVAIENDSRTACADLDALLASERKHRLVAVPR